MFHFKIRSVVTAVLAFGLLSGCATTPPIEQTAELQRSALQRWSACLERHADTDKMPLMEVSRLMRQDCEGYKRDILALYPPHMAGQVDQMLAMSAYKQINSLQNHEPEPLYSVELLQAVLR